MGHFTSYIEETLREASGVTRDDASLDQLVRIPLHEETVFVRAWLTFVTVHHEVAREHALWRETPLGASRKASATATEHGRFLDFIVYLG
jgi:hypothetical protein